MKKTIYLLILFLILFMTLFATENISKKSESGLRKSTVTSDLWVNVNRMNGVFRNNGTWFYDNILGDWGLEWPKGSGLSPIFGAGQFLGANVGGTVKVAASYHNHTEFQAGQIIGGEATNPLDPQYRWYVIRPDGVGDWDSWPFHQGAPALKAADGTDSLDGSGNKIPKLIGDITAYCVINDFAEHAEFATPKLGAEIGMTLWAFNRADAVGDMIFIKWTLINKSAETWDETYFAIWSDPDVGDGWDDFVGCDTVLGLGYCYNANDNDQNYGVAPPAVGIDFFQGPIVDSPGDEVSLPDGSVLTDKKMLKMTSFIYYNNDDSNQGNPQTGGDVWNYLRGLWRDGNPITFGGTGTDPNGDPAPFMFSGDPETGDGWLDTDESDRRFMMTTGPYPNEPWVDSDGDGIAEFGEPGVQEIVAGAMVGKGSSNLNSVTFLKAIDEIAQLAYDKDFALPAPPKQPLVSKSVNNNEALLTWDDRSEFLDEAKTEPYEVADIVANGLIGQMIVVDGEYKEVTDGTYNFTGYTVYQYSDSSGSDPVVYAELGVSEIDEDAPYTDLRMIRLERNLNPKVGNVGDALINGQMYFFGVAANSYCKFAVPKVFSSSPTFVTIVPQMKPGERYFSEFGDSLSYTDTEGNVNNALEHKVVNENLPASDGSALGYVVDPSKVTGHDYEVRFTPDEATGGYFWNLIDKETGETILADQTNQRGDDAYNVADGLLVKVMGPTAGVHGAYLVANGNGPIEDGLNEEEKENAVWHLWNVDDWPGWGTGQADSSYFFVTHGGGDQTYESMLERVFRGENWSYAQANVYEMRFTATGGHIWNRYVTGNLNEVPFELWYMGPDVNDTSDDVRMVAWSNDANGNDIWDFSGDDPTSSNADDPMSDWVYWGMPSDETPGSAGYEADVADGFANYAGHEIMARTTLMNWNCGASHADSVLLSEMPHSDPNSWDATDTTFLINRGWFIDADNDNGVVTVEGDYAHGLVLHMPDEGCIIRWVTNKPNSENDYYVFTAPDAKTVDKADLKEDIKKISVVPNPYYGYHRNESNIFARWVQFNNLPANQKVTIKIFDLAGNRIKTLDKPEDATTILQYDLKNEYDLPIASGIYVYHVEVKGIGKKVGKMAVFAPNERLDTY